MLVGTRNGRSITTKLANTTTLQREAYAAAGLKLSFTENQVGEVRC